MNPSSEKIISLDDFLKQRDRLTDKKIVFTNGCFDLLHPGHVDYLERAKALGDVLVVGLNSDESVRRLKGPKRPINPEMDRALVLAGLGCVNFVIIFSEDTPYNLIKAVQPDVLVKGGDWPIDKIVGKDIVLAKGGEVKSLDFLPGYSTTSLIDKIKNT
ncbi:D-glycero-beta-D-manno-heptose 1-phosphate adenylyltransferase [Desulfohalobiaceae bacterium Ax17]|uniref:D-glycero-beta-D-manno-heptose 1-phosphate adenylyltransferase n=1 Tax=Desulfovulcanus ferrireducens TaxID=2831190 RepID=UPI00207BCAE7|nr:D-glycero-beta-D-manno-heptose 1-phosphate adenylyltransferase [Desulfovulcanus ferrireducens]MBT8762545.1 D-glycero-beta-D-manno-heptose 1-phosphate adenylyltransferase [Desulfovulcanus ferrireducens]